MNLRYYDTALHRFRFKRRYVWAAWAFALGVCLGALISRASLPA